MKPQLSMNRDRRFHFPGRIGASQKSSVAKPSISVLELLPCFSQKLNRILQLLVDDKKFQRCGILQELLKITTAKLYF